MNVCEFQAAVFVFLAFVSFIYVYIYRNVRGIKSQKFLHDSQLEGTS